MQPGSEKGSYLEELSCKADSQKRISSVLTKTRTTSQVSGIFTTNVVAESTVQSLFT